MCNTCPECLSKNRRVRRVVTAPTSTEGLLSPYFSHTVSDDPISAELRRSCKPTSFSAPLLSGVDGLCASSESSHALIQPTMSLSFIHVRLGLAPTGGLHPARSRPINATLSPFVFFCRIFPTTRAIFSITNLMQAAGTSSLPAKPVSALQVIVANLPCGCGEETRNLVVCIDGTSNKFGQKVRRRLARSCCRSYIITTSEHECRRTLQPSQER